GAVVLGEAAQVVQAELVGAVAAGGLHVEGVGEKPAVVVPAPDVEGAEDGDEEAQPRQLLAPRAQPLRERQYAAHAAEGGGAEEQDALGPGHAGEGEVGRAGLPAAGG